MKTNVRKIAPQLLIATALFFSLPLLTRADTVALSFSGHTGEGTAADATLGWSFSLSSNLLLTNLGVWDGNNTQSFGAAGDGLLSSHLVSIWTSTGTLVASVTVPAGGGILLNGFRYGAIAPTLLAAGNYVIGAYYANGNLDHNAAFAPAGNVNTAPGVAYIDARSGAGNGLPSGVLSGTGIWGPNFQFLAAPAAVPEGGSSAILLAISSSLLVWKRRRGTTVKESSFRSPTDLW